MFGPSVKIVSQSVMSLFNYIKNQVSILDVIGEHVQLKPAGTYWKGPCPFHSETDASFTVSPDKQIFYCFGCHTSGDLIAFTAKKENLSQIEAARQLIDQYSLKIPDQLLKQSASMLSNSEDRESYFRVCKTFAEWANAQLLNNQSALAYLANRKIGPELIKMFQIGYLPGGSMQMNHLIKDLGKKNILTKELLESGIVMDGKSALYSPFEERILFPIRDNMGRCCGFGGRIFRPGDERPKYYNSKENDGFVKGKLLFGLDLAKKAMQDSSFAFLVEGYMDCVTMAQHGYINTVATLGTACTQEHLKTVARYCDKLYILYDGDQAGQKAILRMAELCFEVNLELYVIKLPANEDPASFLSKGSSLDAMIPHARDIFSFFIESLGSNFFTKSLAQKMTLIEKILQLIGNLSDPIKQDLLLQEASSILQIPFQSLKGGLSKNSQRKNQQHYYEAQAEGQEPEVQTEALTVQTGGNEISLLEEKIFSAIVSSSLGEKDKRLTIEPELVPYFSQHFQKLLRHLDLLLERSPDRKNFFGSFLETLDEEEKEWVIRISMQFEEVLSAELFNQLIFHFCKHNWKHIVRDLKAQMLTATENANTVRLSELFNLFSKLKQGIQTRGLV